MMGLLQKAQTSFAEFATDESIKQRALHYLEQWLTQPEYAEYQPQIAWQIETGKWSALVDQFYQVLPFGTGGRRGAVGIGPNRMNRWTLAASVQGHCEYLRERFPGSKTPLQVVLAYDVRQFEDTRAVYHPQLPNPVLHLSSRDLAQTAACVYIANGIEVHILPGDSPRFLATPELSFAIRYLEAHGGLNISASHNPPDDNGGKFYEERGGQPVPPEDQIMSDLVEQVKNIKRLAWEEATRSGKIHWLDDATHKAYIELCARESLISSPRFDEFKVVFTPLHGVGGMTAMEVLETQGFRPIPVEEQMEPNGQFPNVTKSPNPEVPVSMDQAESLAKDEQADLILATDPDADRLGGMVSTSLEGGAPFQYVTGNQIGALLTHFKLSQLAEQGRLPASPLVVTTEVTTTLITRIARHFNASVVNNLLVGFKFIADVLWQLESTGQYEDIHASPNDFIIGTEESHGYLLTPKIRDKDAAGAALLLAELTLDRKRKGQTIPEYLDTLYREFGYFKNVTENIAMQGIEGRQQMTAMLEALRHAPPSNIAGLPVTQFEDLRDENGRMGPLKGATDAAGRNFLIFRLGEASGPEGLIARVVLRPSGTEPKAKAYVEVGCAPCPADTSPENWAAICQKVDDQASKLGKRFVEQALATVGVR